MKLKAMTSSTRGSVFHSQCIKPPARPRLEDREPPGSAFPTLLDLKSGFPDPLTARAVWRRSSWCGSWSSVCMDSSSNGPLDRQRRLLSRPIDRTNRERFWRRTTLPPLHRVRTKGKSCSLRSSSCCSSLVFDSRHGLVVRAIHSFVSATCFGKMRLFYRWLNSTPVLPRRGVRCSCVLVGRTADFSLTMPSKPSKPPSDQTCVMWIQQRHPGNRQISGVLSTLAVRIA